MRDRQRMTLINSGEKHVTDGQVTPAVTVESAVTKSSPPPKARLSPRLPVSIKAQCTAYARAGLGLSGKVDYEKQKCVHTFVPTWSEEFDWVEFDGEKMTCKWCRQYPKLANTYRAMLVQRKNWHTYYNTRLPLNVTTIGHFKWQ